MTEHTYEYAFPRPLTGSLEQVFEALTQPAALDKWFAEHVEIDAREGGAFRFWGRHTYGQPTAEDANQVLVTYAPPTQLAFSWRLLDRDSTVTWTLADATGDEGPQSKITVRHHFDALPGVGRSTELIDDLWRIYTGALCAYLDGEDDIYRPDFADQSPEIRTQIVIDAPPNRVFAALIVPEHIKRWFPAPAPVVEPRVGGDYGFGMSLEVDGKTIEPPPMKILELVENQKLSITWPDWRMDPAVPDQRVTWILEDLGGKTRLTLVHDGFTRPVDVSDYPFGWLWFLGRIRDVAHSLV